MYFLNHDLIKFYSSDYGLLETTSHIADKIGQSKQAGLNGQRLPHNKKK